jgi:hypothetical protein
MLFICEETMMKKLYTLALLTCCYLLTGSAFAQLPNLRGIYVNQFSSILGNTAKEDSLFKYAQDSSFNYLAFYDLHSFDLTNATKANQLASFLRRGREQYGIPYMGAVGESWNFFVNKIKPYNTGRTNLNERFNVLNVEFEFWTSSSVNPGGYYCTQYLQAANCGCDTAGAFKFYKDLLRKVDSLATTLNVLSETYVGWFNAGQAKELQPLVDRILVHAYRLDPSSVYGYSKTRLGYLAANNLPVNVVPIFSSEPDFMGGWLQSHAQIEAYNKYLADYNADNSSWKPNIRLQGYQWFCYGYMPKPAPGTGGATTTFNPTITASGSTSFCIGGSVNLTASAGDSYLWSNGATTASISVSTAGTYTCRVTSGSLSATTPATTVTVFNAPSVVMTVGAPLSSSVPLTANAAAGSGTISGYQWLINGSTIQNAVGASYDATASGNYSVRVTNSNGCSATSATQAVSVPVPVTCQLTAPSGLTSSNLSSTSVKVSWDPVPQCDTIVVRYKKEGTNIYNYIRMPYSNQTSTTINDLQAGARYSWRVKTVCGTTSSSYSAKKYFTPANAMELPHEELALRRLNDGTELETRELGIDLTVYPNPADYQVRLYFLAEEEAPAQVDVFDLNGRIVLSQQVPSVEGDNIVMLETSQLVPGLYVVSVRTTDTFYSARLSVNH